MATKFDELHVARLFVNGKEIGTVTKMEIAPHPTVPAVPPSKATTLKELVADFNELVAILQEAGVIGGA